MMDGKHIAIRQIKQWRFSFEFDEFFFVFFFIFFIFVLYFMLHNRAQAAVEEIFNKHTRQSAIVKSKSSFGIVDLANQGTFAMTPEAELVTSHVRVALASKHKSRVL